MSEITNVVTDKKSKFLEKSNTIDASSFFRNNTNSTCVSKQQKNIDKPSTTGSKFRRILTEMN